jgi:uncharacterized protein with HEPN domain
VKHPERVEDYLEHIAEAIDRATVQDAVVRNIEIIGEAVNKISTTTPDFIKQYPEIPWAQMRGMRNIAILTRQGLSMFAAAPTPPGVG